MTNLKKLNRNRISNVIKYNNVLFANFIKIQYVCINAVVLKSFLFIYFLEMNIKIDCSYKCMTK